MGDKELGWFDKTVNQVKDLANSGVDKATNSVRAGAEGVRSYAQDITLDADDVLLLETNQKLQMGNEVIDGKLSPIEQDRLAQKIIQNFRTRKEINTLLSEIKTAQLRTFVKSYAFPDREKGTELRPSTNGEDVGMFVDNALGSIKTIGNGALDMTRFGRTPDEKIEGLQLNVIMQAKRTRLAIHNMIAKSPEWLANPSLGFSPRHDSSGITDPYLPWNTLADRDANTSVGQKDIEENTPEHGLENLESIIDAMVGAARNPRNLDKNLNPQSAKITIPGEIMDSSRDFGSDYENELLFSLQFLQAMEKGANEADTGFIMGMIKDHPVLVGGPVGVFICYLLVRYGLIAPLKKLTPGGRIGKVLSPFIAAAEYVGSEFEARTAKNKAKITETNGGTGDASKMEIVEGVKVPKKVAEIAQNALKKLRETKPGEAVFDTVTLDKNGVATRTTNVDLVDAERIKRINQIISQLKKFENGKIDEISLKNSISEAYDGSYIYGKTKGLLKGVSAGVGVADNTKTVGKNILATLQRKALEGVGIAGNLEAERTAKSLATSDKLEPYAFGEKEWNLNNSQESKSILKKLETILAQKDRLKNADTILSKAKNQKLELERIETEMASTDKKLKTAQVITSGHGTAGVKAEGEISNPHYETLSKNAGIARTDLIASLQALKATNVQSMGIKIDKLDINSTSADINNCLAEIQSKIGTTGSGTSSGLTATVHNELTKLGTKNPGSIIPGHLELEGKNMAESMEAILKSVGKMKVEVKI